MSEVHHWRDVKGNPYVQSLDIRMFRKEGYSVKRKVRLRTSSKLSAQEVFIKYEKDFVVAKLHSILKPLMLAKMPKSAILSLVSEALSIRNLPNK